MQIIIVYQITKLNFCQEQRVTRALAENVDRCLARRLAISIEAGSCACNTQWSAHDNALFGKARYYNNNTWLLVGRGVAILGPGPLQIHVLYTIHHLTSALTKHSQAIGKQLNKICASTEGKKKF